MGKGLDCFEEYFVHIQMLAEGIIEEQILSSFVGEVVDSNVLPHTFRDVSGSIGCTSWVTFA